MRTVDEATDEKPAPEPASPPKAQLTTSTPQDAIAMIGSFWDHCLRDVNPQDAADILLRGDDERILELTRERAEEIMAWLDRVLDALDGEGSDEE